MNIIYAKVLYTMTSGDKIYAPARFDATEAEMREFRSGFSDETKNRILTSFLSAIRANEFMELRDATMNGSKINGIAIIAVNHIAHIELTLTEHPHALN